MPFSHVYYKKKRLVARIQHGGCRHLEFTQTDAVPSFVDQISSNLVRDKDLVKGPYL